MASSLWSLWKEFALGVVLMFWVLALVELGRMLCNAPRQTGELCGSLAWFFTLLAIM
jgi:hypothetical protein